MRSCITPSQVAASSEFARATLKIIIYSQVEAINRGQKLVNYTGHGSVNQWRGNLLVNEDASQTARHIVQQRLKQSGMRWSDEGAQSILNLRTRTLHRNGELEQYWEDFAAVGF